MSKPEIDVTHTKRIRYKFSPNEVKMILIAKLFEMAGGSPKTQHEPGVTIRLNGMPIADIEVDVVIDYQAADAPREDSGR